MKPLNVLLSAYACIPGRGSEPGVGWHMANAVAQHHNTWVLTRAEYRPAIEAALAAQPVPNLHFVYHDLPLFPAQMDYEKQKKWAELHYYLWQLSAAPVIRSLHRHIGFDVAQHVTFVRYWMPSALGLTDVPFIFGPVGGGETAPAAFYEELDGASRRFEHLRDRIRGWGEKDPFVRRTLRRADLVLTTTPQSAERARVLGAKDVRLHPESGLPEEELRLLATVPPPPSAPVRFISVGRLLHWKGFHLGLRAFAMAGLPDAEYLVVGDGPYREELETLTSSLGLHDRVRFYGRQSRDETLRLIGESHVLVHPSLHDSGGWVCLEAMASRRPVLCLDLGGPGQQVTSQTGFAVRALNPAQAVADLAEKMRLLASDDALRAQLGAAGPARVRAHYTWSAKMDTLLKLYEEVAGVAQEMPLRKAA